MARFRMYPTSGQEQQMLLHCAQARYVWNLAVEQRSFWARHKGASPGYVELARQLTEARAASEWLREGNAEVQQQALRDFDQAVKRRFTSGFGEPSWRKRYRHEGFRVIGIDRIPEFEPDGSPKLNAKGKQVMARSVAVQKLNRRWVQVKVPGCGWVRFRLTRRDLPAAKTFRVTWRRGQWHVAFAVILESVDPPGTGGVVGVDRGVAVTAALSDGRKLTCPQLNDRECARLRKHERRAARAPKGSPQKAGLNRAILAQGWGLLRTRTEQKAPGRVEDVPAPYTSLRCSDCGWIEKDSRKSQAEFSCVSCGFTCNADTNAAMNVAAGQGGVPRPRSSTGAGGTTARQGSSVREPQRPPPR
ncbi:RNA-guided endonuclease InsQ/TnpB family protein [Glycomyces buryatensis]|uniref:Transposase n=1 Tax=Glycomyces buryatensis TaxID=2570927 RepID=A0A4V4HRN2_9ACTN|nr:zinc ribbon domain-containing protein [Glycomyces buryatensis]THV38546.1 transposase [Glycomyces buryatensis]